MFLLRFITTQILQFLMFPSLKYRLLKLKLLRSFSSNSRLCTKAAENTSVRLKIIYIYNEITCYLFCQDAATRTLNDFSILRFCHQLSFRLISLFWKTPKCPTEFGIRVAILMLFYQGIC